MKEQGSAESTLGMCLGSDQRRDKFIIDMLELLEEVQFEPAVCSKELWTALVAWLEVEDDPDKFTALEPGVLKLLEVEDGEDIDWEFVNVKKGTYMFVRRSRGAIGGDSWAYRMGSGLWNLWWPPD